MESDDSKVGFVSSNLGHGSVFLKNDQGAVTRLAWEAIDEETDDRGESDERPHQPVTEDEDGGRLLALPVGTYTLAGYRFCRKDKYGANWFISAILAHYDEHQIIVRPGKVSRIEIDPTVVVSCRANATEKLIVQAGVQGMHGAGLTIYREGRRIPMGFTISAANGKLLETGEMDYG
ncbi:MAG: hypothetical protein ACR2RV_10355 [Verrucomicrobiales bacterium]